MKKLKFLSKLLAVFVIVPAILLLTACGGGQLAQEAKLEKKEFTKLESVTEFKEKLAEIEETEIVSGYHMTFAMKMNMMGMEFENFDMNMYYIPAEEVEDIKIAAKFDAKMNMNIDMGIPGVDPVTATSEMEGTMYVTDGYAYTDVKGEATDGEETEDLSEKSKVPFVLGSGDDPTAMATYFTDLNTILEMVDFEAMQDVEGVEFFVAKDGTQLKMVIDAFEEEGIEVEKYEMIFQFDGNQLTGFAIDVKMAMTDGDESIPMEMKITVAPFEGEIDMPKNFDGYTEEE